VLVDQSPASPVRILDFGLMVHIPSVVTDSDALPLTGAPESCAYRGMTLHGTPGLFAPETIMHFDYSIKSDVWQLGCILYSLLSGMHPFSPTRIDRILSASYFPMEGEHWVAVSESAKLLVSSMLQMDPSLRPSADDILAHHWLNMPVATVPHADQSSTPPLDEAYASRIKGLVLTQKLRSVFLKRDLVSRDVERASRRDLTRGLRAQWADARAPEFQSPRRTQGGMLAVRPESIDECESVDESEAGGYDDGSSIEERLEDLRAKFKEQALLSISTSKELGASACHVREGKDGLPRVQQSTGRELLMTCDYKTYVELLTQCHLQQLATRNAYEIFNHSSNGTININEMIESLQAVFHHSDPMDVKSFDCIVEDVDLDDEEALNIFRMLDTKHRGLITCDEMKIGLRCIMLAEHVKSHRKMLISPTSGRRQHGGLVAAPLAAQHSSLSNASYMSNSTFISVQSIEVEALFKRLDHNTSGQLDFEAFKQFYVEAVAPNFRSSTLSPFSIDEIEVTEPN
jgi:Ca2+-binding EF-hand superfamily protein